MFLQHSNCQHNLSNYVRILKAAEHPGCRSGMHLLKHMHNLQHLSSSKREILAILKYSNSKVIVMLTFPLTSVYPGFEP